MLLAQKMLYMLRNLLVMLIGIDELETDQAPQRLARLIKSAYGPIAANFLTNFDTFGL